MGHLGPLVAWIVARHPVAGGQGAARRHHPKAAARPRRCIVFVVPVVLLLPLKLLGLWLLAHRSMARRDGVLVFAKLVGLGVTAFIFDLTRPKLLQLAWFRWLYEHVLVWLEKAHALIDPIKAPDQGAWLRIVARRSAPGRALRLLRASAGAQRSPHRGQ